MKSAEELERWLGRLQKQVDTLPGVGPSVNTVAQSNDVRIGGTTALADGDVLTYVAADGQWENAPATGGGGGSATPTDWLTLYNYNETGIARSTTTTVSWHILETHGTAVTVGGGVHADGNTVTFNEDGWYTLGGYVFTHGSSAAFDTFNLRLHLVRSFAIGGDTQPTADVYNEVGPSELTFSTAVGELQFHWVGYFKAGDTAHVEVLLDGSGGSSPTYSISDGAWEITKLPMSGGSGSASFPVTYDDGTNTYEITAGATIFDITVNRDAGGQDAYGNIEVKATATEGSVLLVGFADNGDTSEVHVDGLAGIQVAADNGIFFSGLPTSNPGGSNQMWNNGGVLSIT